MATSTHPVEVQLTDNIAKTVADLVKTLHNPQLVTVTDGATSAPAALIPRGMELQSVEGMLGSYRERPRRRRGTASFTDLDSLIAHANRFKGEHSALFAIDDRKAPQLISVINYNQAGFDGAPEHADHRGHYHFPLSDEWKAWDAVNGRMLEQGEFAEFIEDRIGDVTAAPTEAADPSFAKGRSDGEGQRSSNLADLQKLLGGTWAGQSTLMDMSRGMKINEAARVKQATNLQTGEVQVQYETEHKDQDGAPVKVPNMFLIIIPVFHNGPLYRIAVRLRYRLREGRISWAMQMYRPDLVFDDAFKEGCNRAAQATELPLFIGKPETAGGPA
ncbi:DUF2303 family protein [Oceanibaculum indicum]|uniref:DUF2303 family protein n=1 Tax=Oceanibaculum indicum P24 TaxID=1207063 RepID=K2JU82_9PROT|nr:DUF2303 family protein [Oceanibaculum indicum]EKE68720.1 hypothetical protein P24_17302 [Oceanibaculum indicum P24]